MQVCRRIAAEQGLPALNMRTVAKECGIALGTLYNYYSDKDELLIATIGSVWQDIFHVPQEDKSSGGALPFPEYVGRLFRHVQAGFREYPDFFTAHSVAVTGSNRYRQGAAKDPTQPPDSRHKAKNAMDMCFAHIRSSLLAALRQDKSIAPGAFSGDLTEEGFVEFVLDNIIVLLVQNKSCEAALTEMISRIIYTS